MPTPPSSEGRITEDEATRPRKPIPRAKQPSQTQSAAGGGPDVSSSTNTSPTRTYPTPPGTTANPLSRGPQWIGPTGGVSLSPSQSLQQYPNTSAIGSNSDNLIANFFDAALYGVGLAEPSTGLQGSVPSSSASTVPLPNWEGILSQQQNPYGSGGFGAAGIIAPDMFNPYVGYQGPGGPLGFAAEAHAFLGNEDDVNWQDALNIGYVDSPCAANYVTHIRHLNVQKFRRLEPGTASPHACSSCISTICSR